MNQKRNNGEGNINPFGYIRIRDRDGKLRMQHNIVWEKHKGKIPLGYDVHHIDGNKQNNRLINLELLTRKDHIRKHKGWYKKNNLWYKPCNYCKRDLEVNTDNYYFATKNNNTFKFGTLLAGKCKACHIKEVDHARKIKKTAARPLAVPA